MNMKKIFCLLAIAAALSCAKKPQEFHVVPMPAQVELTDGSFNVAGAAVTFDDNMDEASLSAAFRFVESLETATGKQLKLGPGGFEFVVNPDLAPEQYVLDICKKGVKIQASALNGFVYACETLKQMLPAAIYGKEAVQADWVLPCGHIDDQPRYAYRGAHLDACRHFWTVEETKRYLDVMTAYKLNRFHWHLTEDQGWRIEIKAYPKLTEIGAWRNGTMIKKDLNSNDGIRYGGYYTQEELRDVVAYAAERGITIIPEFDLPGHATAVLASYPELGCTGGPYEVASTWWGMIDILCAGNEQTFTFIENVFKEIVDIFPSEYIHIGGDECFPRNRVAPWETCPKCAARMRSLGIKKGPEAKHYLQNYVTARVQKIMDGMGRKIIGWDEILQGELAPGATVMSWRGVKGGIEAASKGFDVVMSPNNYMYLDYYQSLERDKEPFGIGGHLPLEVVYSYEPTEGMPESAWSHILGVQCNLWTEYIATPEHLEYMLLPRMCAASEVQWCAADKKDYERFYASLPHTFDILDAMELTYCMDSKGLIGLDRESARDSLALVQYLEESRK